MFSFSRSHCNFFPRRIEWFHSLREVIKKKRRKPRVLPVYELAERYPTRVAVLSGGHRLDDGQRLQLLPDQVRLEVERFVGQRGPYASDEMHTVLVFRRVSNRPEYFHTAGPVHRRRCAHATRLRILSARFRVVFLQHTHTHQRINTHLYF